MLHVHPFKASLNYTLLHQITKERVILVSHTGHKQQFSIMSGKMKEMKENEDREAEKYRTSRAQRRMERWTLDVHRLTNCTENS